MEFERRELGASFLCVKESLKEKLISIKELKTVLQCLGFSPSGEEVENIFHDGQSMSFEEYCKIAKNFPKFNEEDINELFSKCIPVSGGKMKMTDFVRAFGPLANSSSNGNSLTATDGNFTTDDNINLTSVISNIAKVTNELKELSGIKYDKVMINRIDTESKTQSHTISVSERSSPYDKLRKTTTLKGSFYLENDTIISHQYSFTVPCVQDYAIIVKQNNLPKKYNSDVLAFLFKDENGKRTYIGHTNHLAKDLNQRCICTLMKGKYVIVPYSTGCFLNNKEFITKEIQLIEMKPNVTLTDNFLTILKDIFSQVDLDNNGLLSRQEFNLYNWRTSGDIVEDDEWQTLQENFDVVDGELSEKGFISLHQLEADDCDGKTDDLWLSLEAMGYNREGKQDQATHFEVSVCSASVVPNLIVSGLRSGGPLLQDAFVNSLVKSVTPSSIDDNKDILVYKELNSNRGSIIIKNRSSNNYVVRSDCSKSVNCVSHRQDLNFLLQIGKYESVIAHHLFPKDTATPFTIISKESIQS